MRPHPASFFKGCPSQLPSTPSFLLLASAHRMASSAKEIWLAITIANQMVHVAMQADTGASIPSAPAQPLLPSSSFWPSSVRPHLHILSGGSVRVGQSACTVHRASTTTATIGQDRAGISRVSTRLDGGCETPRPTGMGASSSASRDVNASMPSSRRSKYCVPEPTTDIGPAGKGEPEWAWRTPATPPPGDVVCILLQKPDVDTVEWTGARIEVDRFAYT